MGMIKSHMTLVGIVIGIVGYELMHRRAKGA